MLVIVCALSRFGLAVVGAAAVAMFACVVVGAQAQVGHAPALAAAPLAESVSANGHSGSPAISAGGRFVVFESDAPTLVVGDTNDQVDVFVRDRAKGTTGRVSVSGRGAQANKRSGSAAVSADGRVVVFSSQASDLVAGTTYTCQSYIANFVGVPPDLYSYDCWDVFVRDRSSGKTTQVSVSSSGAHAQGVDIGPWDSGSRGATVSAQGRFVAFQSDAWNLVAGDTNKCQYSVEGVGIPFSYSCWDVFVHDRANGTTERVSVSSNEAQTNDWSSSLAPAISADGRYVAFVSDASNLVDGDTNHTFDVFVRDRVRGTTERVSLTGRGAQSNDASGFSGVAISTDGRFVAFDSRASNLVPRDTNRHPDVFVRDRLKGATARVSVSNRGAQANDQSGFSGVAISANGRFVVFDSDASNLVTGDRNDQPDVFVRDRTANKTERVNVIGGKVAHDSYMGGDFAITADGRFVAFDLLGENRLTGREIKDVFLRDRVAKKTTLISVARQ